METNSRSYIFFRYSGIILFSIMTCICSKLTWNSYNKWKDNPIIISQENQMSTVSSIPFPAVTICPYKKLNMEERNMSKFLSKVNDKSINITNEE